MADTEELHDLAHAVLDEVVTIFATAGVTLPSIQFVSDGSVAYDCDVLAVEIRRIYVGTPSIEQGREVRRGDRLTVELAIHLVRCSSEASQPTLDLALMEDAAKAKNVDGAVMVRGLLSRIEEKAFLGNHVKAKSARVLDLNGAGPEGAIAGWVQGLRVVL